MTDRIDNDEHDDQNQASPQTHKSESPESAPLPTPDSSADEPVSVNIDQNMSDRHDFDVDEEDVSSSDEEEPASEDATTAVHEEDVSTDDSEEPGEESEQSAADEPAEVDVPDTKRWYVVKVQSGREESIKEAIERRVKIESLEDYFGEVLIPVEKETIMRNGKRVVREKKLFPGYIMARVEYNDQILYLFRETSGVGDFVGGGVNQTPQPMSDHEVARMLGGKPDDKKPKEDVHASPFSLGDRVKVKDGVFSGMDGEVKEILENLGKIRVELFVLGRPVSVELEYWQAEAL